MSRHLRMAMEDCDRARLINRAALEVAAAENPVQESSELTRVGRDLDKREGELLGQGAGMMLDRVFDEETSRLLGRNAPAWNTAKESLFPRRNEISDSRLMDWLLKLLGIRSKAWDAEIKTMRGMRDAAGPDGLLGFMPVENARPGESMLCETAADDEPVERLVCETVATLVESVVMAREQEAAQTAQLVSTSAAAAARAPVQAVQAVRYRQRYKGRELIADNVRKAMCPPPETKIPVKRLVHCKMAKVDRLTPAMPDNVERTLTWFNVMSSDPARPHQSVVTSFSRVDIVPGEPGQAAQPPRPRDNAVPESPALSNYRSLSTGTVQLEGVFRPWNTTAYETLDIVRYQADLCEIDLRATEKVILFDLDDQRTTRIASEAAVLRTGQGLRSARTAPELLTHFTASTPQGRMLDDFARGISRPVRSVWAFGLPPYGAAYASPMASMMPTKPIFVAFLAPEPAIPKEHSMWVRQAQSAYAAQAAAAARRSQVDQIAQSLRASARARGVLRESAASIAAAPVPAMPRKRPHPGYPECA